ncbi:hypothetical protein AB205_0205040 [Aquarana catesbeiana]|uniref:Uncharacterized protein n=1 Tax=Aquarana catesbeiana TaxID=8400 RepID=A0A2G9QAF9_AQUCT|nr:hypothetical protein AB205_0205040 [Aquarana catesbeiana]
MYTFCGCNPFLATQVGERKGLHLKTRLLITYDGR